MVSKEILVIRRHVTMTDEMGDEACAKFDKQPKETYSLYCIVNGRRK